MKRLLLPLCAFALALGSAGSALAVPVLSAGTITSGSLTFTNFTCSFNGTNIFTGACSSIDVAALTPQPSGIMFSTDMAVIGGPSGADAALTFNVSSPSAISAVGLSFNSTFEGMDVNSVTEDVYTSLGGTLVGTATVYCGFISGCAATTVDNIMLNGAYDNLYITKDINLIAANGTSSGSTSIITQTFTTTATPEPISLTLMGGGLALFGLAGLRKRSK